MLLISFDKVSPVAKILIRTKEKGFGCGIFGFCLLLFPQKKRKINELRELSLSQFVYFLSTKPSMFTFTKYFLFLELVMSNL